MASVTARDTLDKMCALRMSSAEKAEIEARAEHAGMTMSRYMVAAALGTLGDPSSIDERFEDLEARLDKLERLAFDA